MFTTQYCYS